MFVSSQLVQARRPSSLTGDTSNAHRSVVQTDTSLARGFVRRTFHSHPVIPNFQSFADRLERLNPFPDVVCESMFPPTMVGVCPRIPEVLKVQARPVHSRLQVVWV